MAQIPLTLTFLGGAGTVTGSKYLLTAGSRRIMVDAGMFQGIKDLRLLNRAELPIDPLTVSDLLLTHAHADHCSYIPALVKQGFRGNIWATEGTIELAEIVLRDAGRLQEMETDEAIRGGYSKHEHPEPLYTSKDVETALPLFKLVKFETPLDLGNGFVAVYSRAGHILGSASIRVQYLDTSVIFSGDLGRHNHPILKPRAIPQGGDFVLIESTYGDRQHLDPQTPFADVADAITSTVARGGQVVIPAFAVDRTEAVLRALTMLYRGGRIPDVPVFVDGPMALAALDVYRNPHLDELRDDLDVDDFMGMPQIFETRTAKKSKQINKFTKPCIIISSSGMAEGGRVLHHLARCLPEARNTVILTGYQAEGTRGRSLEEGARQIKIHGRYVRVRAKIVRSQEFSVHADQSDLLDWLAALNPKPKTAFLVHGEPEAALTLANQVETTLGIEAVIPRINEVVLLSPSLDEDPGD